MKIPILIRIRIAQTYETRIVKYTEMGGRTRRVQDPHRSGQLTRFSVRIFTAFGRPFLVFLFYVSFFQIYNCFNQLAYIFSKITHSFLSFQVKFCIVCISAEFFSRLQNLFSSARFKSSKLMCKKLIFATNWVL